ncbi:DNA recombination protein RmuC [Mesonia sp. K7]|uniref:DNA recombination protein RmuC n=1 Tax=Mesonia sp. K7 TaxID=2218606 RepID=UPI000DA9EA6D|nr:DNA recombination protein RmuC [Mesonia sp. K7]PZD77885.1 DNA recombination protein RmuC [Mesonia sp. K7]
MDINLISIIIILAVFTVAFLLAWFISKSKSQQAQKLLNEKSIEQQSAIENYKLQIERLEIQMENNKKEYQTGIQKIISEREEIRKEKDLLKNSLTQKNVEYANLEEKLSLQKEEVEKLQEKFTKEFENLANKILDQKSEKFTTQNKENIKNILEPLQEKIKGFEEKVTQNREESIKMHVALGEQLKHLNEQNLKISEEANNLTKALKGDTKTQGNWGEMILKTVLEKSGLEKDREFFLQENHYTEQGKRVMPDVVIKLPGNKKMIIDSKVSLNAYEKYMNETDDKEREGFLKSHLLSVKNRVDELSKKEYHKIYQMESPDFVLLFIPIEAAFAVASNYNPNLYNEAFDKNIILVTPTTLLAVLKTIDSMWQNEKQKQNALDIANQAGALYDSFVNLTEELIKVGKQIGTVQNSYESAMKKLTGKGNLIRRVEKLKKLGAKASKQINTNLLARAQDEEE